MSVSSHDTHKQSETGRKPTLGTGENPPFGWYYFGPEPPWKTSGAAPSSRDTNADASGEDNTDLMRAFDRLSRGEVNAETIGKLFDLKDRDFWKGALAGAAAALAANNLPALKAMAASVMAGAFAQATPAKPAAASTAKTDKAPDPHSKEHSGTQQAPDQTTQEEETSV
ncbi:hypothetical protein [Celeribacter persicus]|uniref:Uncharacterized protein n=1 Tax=Celeribacter persicus TaxID=1651082 RepID=A0A2T5HJY4_9RHOB|nr:hypothetical protein [Celeribacter persicus]PTQ71888.1 hypothetical protein C8N42_10767 [Celeribacter persicus]